MKPRTLDVMFAVPAYSGNGGSSSEAPEIRQWMCSIIPKMKDDPRIGEIYEVTISDTPITMVRNRFVLMARDACADILIMVDSDMNPELHINEPGYMEFFASSFDFLYDHYEKGPCVIGAPYCGPPGVRGENVYVFHWSNYGDQHDNVPFSLEQFTRSEAARMRGIQEVGALPTGLIMYDMRAFELIEPCSISSRDVLEQLVRGEIGKEEALGMLNKGWFYYEWPDGTASDKSSTEDVTNTRDISLAGTAKFGYNPVYCNWDAPAGHFKYMCVSGRPRLHEPHNIVSTFRKAIVESMGPGEVVVEASEAIRQFQEG